MNDSSMYDSSMYDSSMYDSSVVCANIGNCGWLGCLYVAEECWVLWIHAGSLIIPDGRVVYA
jgi:hypothetical protein